MLYNLAVSSGAEIILGAAVTAVTPGEPKPSITLASGEVHTADIVLGADGPNSFIREVVLGEDSEEGKPSGYSVLGAVIPGDKMAKDPELAGWLAADEVKGLFEQLLHINLPFAWQWPIFMGNNRSVCGKNTHLWLVDGSLY